MFFNQVNFILKLAIYCLLSSSILFPQSAASADWQKVIRNLPYEFSQGFHSNLSQIRHWVLLQKGFCEKVDRHILFNYRGRFLGYIENLTTSELNQQKLNQTRQSFYQSNRVHRWIKGTPQQFGYPFALNCNQPHADLDSAFKRLFGKNKADRLWGTWDGLSAGTKKTPIPLIELVEQVYHAKSKVIEQPLVASEFRYFLAQIIIESGAQKNGLSKANAIGLLQLKPSVLKDCQIPKKFYRHRMAQVDCAVRLFQQNRRNLLPIFEQVFGHLPKAKQNTVFSMLLVQSYHSGIGRISRLLTDPAINQAASHFALKHHDYSAEDIASGLIYHNLGRADLGFASLYYVIDVAVTAEKLCQFKQVKQKWFCS